MFICFAKYFLDNFQLWAWDLKIDFVAKETALPSIDEHSKSFFYVKLSVGAWWSQAAISSQIKIPFVRALQFSCLRSTNLRLGFFRLGSSLSLPSRVSLARQGLDFLVHLKIYKNMLISVFPCRSKWSAFLKINKNRVISVILLQMNYTELKLSTASTPCLRIPGHVTVKSYLAKAQVTWLSAHIWRGAANI